MVRGRAVLTLLGGAWLCAGCGLFGSKEAPPPLPALKASVPVRIVSRAQVGKSIDVQSSPNVDGDRYYVAGEPGVLAAFDAANGRPLWRVDTKERLAAGVGSGEGLVLVGTRKGDVLAFDRDGKARWRGKVTSDVAAAPAIGQGIVVVRSGDGRVSGLSAVDGKVKWSFVRTTPVLVLYESGAPVVVDKTAYVPIPGGKLVAAELDTGNVLWEAAVALPKGATELERVADVTGFPAVDSRVVCASTFQGRVACLENGSGNAVWAHDASVPYGQAAESGKIVVSDDRGRVSAYRRSDGAQLWSQEKLQGRHLSGPALIERAVVVGDIEGYVHFLDPDSGELTGRVPTDGSPVVGQVVAAGKGAVAATAKGGLYLVAAP